MNEEQNEQVVLTIEEAYNDQIEKEKEMTKDYKTPISLNTLTRVQIDAAKGVRKVNTKNGTRMVYDLLDKPEECLMASPYLHSLLIKALIEGINSLTIIKTEQNGKTKYEIEPTEQ
jgi:hypothetical protein